MNQQPAERGSLARSLASIVVGLLLAAVLMQASGYNALEAFSALWIGATGLQAGPSVSPSDIALGSGHLSMFMLAQSLAKVTPLLFCGLAVALGLRAGLFNIGAQGQMTVGALAAAAMGLIGATGAPVLPAPLHILLTLAAGALAGAAWGAIPGLLKAWRGVHEVITTIMLNFIGVNVVTYIVAHNLKDPDSQNIQTVKMASTSLLTPLVPHSNLTISLLLALLMAAGLALLINRTSLGYAIRAVGLSPEAAEAAGISTARTVVIAMALSGALAGVAGAVEVMGIHHRYVDGVAGTYGFDGIAVALLAGLGGGGTILSALFFGLLANGSQSMETSTHVPAPIAVVVQAVVILFVCIRFRGSLFAARGIKPAIQAGNELLLPENSKSASADSGKHPPSAY